MKQVKLNKYGNVPTIPQNEAKKFLSNSNNQLFYPTIYLMIKHNNKTGSYMIAQPKVLTTNK